MLLYVSGLVRVVFTQKQEPPLTGSDTFALIQSEAVSAVFVLLRLGKLPECLHYHLQDRHQERRLDWRSEDGGDKKWGCRQPQVPWNAKEHPGRGASQLNGKNKIHVINNSCGQRRVLVFSFYTYSVVL